MRRALGIDLGASTVRAALVDESGAILAAQRRGLEGRSPEQVIAQIVSTVSSLDAEALALPAAIGVAAQLWVRTGVVAVAPNLGWVDVPFGELLARAFKHPVRVVNDLDAITVGEARCGAGQGSTDVMVIFVGTGLGMGAICQGQLIEGADGLATELGHTKVVPPGQGRQCGCGERGCLETYTAGRHLPALLAEKAATGFASPLLDSVGGRLDRLDARLIEEAVNAGDPAAAALWADVAGTLGLACANAVTMMNPRVVVLGGGVLTSAPGLRDRTVEVMRACTARPALSKVVVRGTELGDRAGLVGAGLLALRL